MATKNIFELNGKAYDGLTGAMLGNAKRVSDTAQVTHIRHMQLRPAPRGNSVDGIVSISSTQRRRPTQPHHVAAHQPQPTKTLMRHAVKAPAAGLHPHKTTHHAGQAVKSPLHASNHALPHKPVAAPVTVAVKQSVSSVDPLRARRATGVGRSQTVQHFKPAELPRRSYQLAPQLTSQAAAPMQRRPALPQFAPQPVPVTRQAAPQARPVRRDDDDFELDLFADALAQAASHEELPPSGSPRSSSTRRRRRQVLGIVGSLSAFLIMIGFIAYQNKAQIQLQMASAKAGFTAAVPLNKPAGYDMAKLSYEPGNVAMQYKSGGDKAFTITQKKSNWDSQTLLENFVATSNEDYQGYQSNGRTVYVYGKGQATWVNGGIWYQIKDGSGLPNEQLVKIAASM